MLLDQTSASNPGSGSPSISYANMQLVSAAVGFSPAYLSLAPTRISLSPTANVYLEAQSTFTVSTSAAYGFVACRRMQ